MSPNRLGFITQEEERGNGKVSQLFVCIRTGHFSLLKTNMIRFYFDIISSARGSIPLALQSVTSHKSQVNQSESIKKLVRGI